MKETAMPLSKRKEWRTAFIHHRLYAVPHSVDRGTGTYHIDYTTGSMVRRTGFGIQFFCPHKWLLIGYCWWWEHETK